MTPRVKKKSERGATSREKDRGAIVRGASFLMMQMNRLLLWNCNSQFVN